MIMIRRIFSTDFLLLPLFLYKCIQIFVMKDRNNMGALASRIFLTLLFTPVVALIIILFGIYYEMISLILRFRHGARFYGMLDGCDRIWAKKSHTRNVICTLNTIRVNGKANQAQELIDYMKCKFEFICQTHPLFSTVLSKFASLDFFYKIDLDLAVCIKGMDDYSTVEELLVVFDRCANKEMPMNDIFLWEILIGTKAIRWETELVYPILYRSHHCLADGATLVALMSTHLLQGGEEIMKERSETLKKLSAKRSNGILMHFERVLNIPTVASPQKPNILHKRPSSGQKHMIFALEKRGSEMVRKVKEIKNFHGVAFTDVISTAISAALYEHFKKYEKNPPKAIISMSPTYLMMLDFKKSLSTRNGVAILEMGNKFSVGFIKMPINIQSRSNNNIIDAVSENSDLLDRLKAMHRAQNELKFSLDYEFSYWQMKMLTGLPNAFGHHLRSLHDATLCVSNIPGNAKCVYTDGSQVTDIVAFANNFEDIGLSITIFTYDGLIRIGIIIDCILIEKREEAQVIGDHIYKYIEDMHSQLNSL